MKNNFLIISLIILGFIGASIFLYYSIHTQQKPTIAIFEPAIHPAMDEIVDGFITTMKQQSPINYTFVRYNANGNKTLMRSQAEEIIQQKHDLAMTIGADPSKTLYELTIKKHSSLPIVFDAVSDPVGLGIIASLDSSENNVTGVEEVPDYQDQINKLLLVKPNTKAITLVYDPSIKAGIHEVWAQEIKAIVEKKNITFNNIKVFHPNEIQAKVQPALLSTDVIMILTDHTTVSGIDSLITLCNRYNITLYASDLNSGIKGAALSYGITQYDLGVDAAKLALQIVADYKLAKDIPISRSNAKKITVNKSTMEKQGINISEDDQKRLQRQGITFI